MSQFEPEPSLLLADKSATLHAITVDTSWKSQPFPFPYRVKSQWLCDELDNYEATIGFPYNAAVQRWIEKREGLEQQADSGSPLSLLIYNAQKYRRSDRLRQEGFAPLTQAMIDEAHRRGVGIEIQGENMLGGTATDVLTVRTVDSKNYAFRPKKRKFAISPNGIAARFANADRKPTARAKAESDVLVLSAS
jgi:hypothetical protein